MQRIAKVFITFFPFILSMKTAAFTMAKICSDSQTFGQKFFLCTGNIDMAIGKKTAHLIKVPHSFETTGITDYSAGEDVNCYLNQNNWKHLGN